MDQQNSNAAGSNAAVLDQAAQGAATAVVEKAKRERIDYEVCETLDALKASTRPTEKQKAFVVTVPLSMFPGATGGPAEVTRYVYANNSDMAVTRVTRKLGASAEAVDSKRKARTVDAGSITSALDSLTPEQREAILKKYLAGATPTVVSGKVGDVQAPASQSMPEFDAANSAGAGTGGATAGATGATEGAPAGEEKKEPVATGATAGATAGGAGKGLGGNRGNGGRMPHKK